MQGKADVIVTEIFDSELLGEGILPTMRHATANLLKVHAARKCNHISLRNLYCTPQKPSPQESCLPQEGGKVVPHAAAVFGQLVESPSLAQVSPRVSCS